MSREIWKPVVGFKSLYEVSNKGRIKSFVDRWPRHGKFRILHYTPDGRVSLRKNGKTYPRRVSRLIAAAFLGPARGRLTRHLDDERSNNKLKNIAYGTRKDNADDAKRNGIKLGRKPKGRKG